MEKVFKISKPKYWALRYTIENGTWRTATFQYKIDLDRMVKILKSQGYTEQNV